MRSLSFFLPILLIPNLLLAAEERPRLQHGDDEFIQGGNVHLNKVVADTVILMGPWGSGAAYNGQFETPGGTSAWNGWTTRDYTEPTGDGYWHVSDYNAANLRGHGAGNQAAYCGDETIVSCGPEDPEGGYGSSWDEAIQWTATVPDPAQPCLVQFEAWLNQDTEPAYDYCFVSIKGPGIEPVDVWVSDGVLENHHLQLEFTCQPEEYTGPEGDRIVLQIRFESDGGWSDVDCLYPSQGAIQIDDISVTLNNGEFQTFDDFQEGLGNWEPFFRPGVGDFAKIWTGLDDLDPCATNYSPQVAFIDDGQVVPGTGGTLCIDWCYGPGGYISNQSGGLAGPDHYLDSMILSPVIPWPGPEYQGCRFDLDRYEHEGLEADSPGIGSLWLFRSTSSPDPADIELASWQDRDSGVKAGGPKYYRDQRGVSDFLEPECRFIQLRLGAWQWGHWWDWVGDNGTPAPYFDNIRIIAYKFFGPGMDLSSLMRASDGFPASGMLDLEDLSTNSVRFDVIRDVSWTDDTRFDAGDSIFCWIAPIRPDAELVEVPRLYFKLKANPVFDPYRTSGLPNEGFVEGWRPLDSYGNPVTYGFAFDLPDTGFFFPGDVLHYFLAATDAVGGADVQTNHVPADTTGFGDFHHWSAYDSDFTVRALPSLQPDPQDPQELKIPGVLFWNRFPRNLSRSYGQTYGSDRLAWHWPLALQGLGLQGGVDFDVFHSSYEDNSLAARATVAQVAGYETLLFSSGFLSENVLGNGDPADQMPDDVGLLEQWLQLGNKNALFMGDHLAGYLATEGGAATEAFLSDWLGLQYVDDQVRPLIGDPFAPLVAAEPANPVLDSVASWVAYTHCGYPGLYVDAVTALAGAQRLAQYTDPSGQIGAYPYAAATLLENAEFGTRVISFPYDLTTIRDDTGGNKNPAPFPARVLLLGDVLSYFGVPFTPDNVTSVPELGPLLVTSYPNPFNPRTRLDFHLPRAGQVSLKVFNVRGELIRTLLAEKRPAGHGEVFWDGRNEANAAVSSGLYFYELRSAGQVKVGKMTLVR